MMEVLPKVMKNGKQILKIITISLSSDCIQSPRCSFCYNKTSHNSNFELWTIENTCKIVLDGYTDKEVSQITMCLEYSGYNLSKLEDVIYLFPGMKINHLTMTTMPCAITPMVLSYIKHHSSTEAIALSYDSQKAKTPEVWLEKAKLIKNAGFQLSCNYLLENPKKVAIPESFLAISDQINLLSLKPDGKMTTDELNILKVYIELLKSRKPVTVDNCLGIQLGLISSCKRGEEFIHILPDGELSLCCFRDRCFIYNE